MGEAKTQAADVVIPYRAPRDDAAERRALPRRALRVLLIVIGAGVLGIALLAGGLWGYVAWQEATWSRSAEASKAGIAKELGTLGPGATFHATNLRVADQVQGVMNFGSPMRRKWYRFDLPKNEIDNFGEHMRLTWRKVPTHLLGHAPPPPSCAEHCPRWWDEADFEKSEQFSLDLFQQPIFYVGLSRRSGTVYVFVGGY